MRKFNLMAAIALLGSLYSCDRDATGNLTSNETEVINYEFSLKDKINIEKASLQRKILYKTRCAL